MFTLYDLFFFVSVTKWYTQTVKLRTRWKKLDGTALINIKFSRDMTSQMNFYIRSGTLHWGKSCREISQLFLLSALIIWLLIKWSSVSYQSLMDENYQCFRRWMQFIYRCKIQIKYIRAEFNSDVWCVYICKYLLLVNIFYNEVPFRLISWGYIELFPSISFDIFWW